MFCFFSSRRRHTRCLSDWSSDVCSSDLAHHCQNSGGLPRLTVLPPSAREAQCLRQQRRAEIRRRRLGQHFGQQVFLVSSVVHFSVPPARRFSVCGGRGKALIPRPFPSSAARRLSPGRTGAKDISVRPVAARPPAARSIYFPATRAIVRPPRRFPSRPARFPAAA